MELIGKTAVITGVSKGIGLALLHELIQKGCSVFGLGRNMPELNNENFRFIETDVRDINSVNQAFRKLLQESSGKLDILINNAGLGYFGNVEELPPAHWDEMWQTNVNGTVYCTRQAVPVMKEKGSGHIINIASTAALEGMPLVSGYCATKWAVRGFSESIWRELRDYKIKVTCVYPGSVKTDFFRNSENIKPHDYMLMPEDVSSMIVRALETPDNFHQVNLEVRPLQPKGPVKKL